ncbi:MAG: sulfatase-like hydrolase/transferase [Deltaproteobacteria bacterium]|nr:sulfatase-like hydrolase/transferase [Deltaproteobacteria bacterium]
MMILDFLVSSQEKLFYISVGLFLSTYIVITYLLQRIADKNFIPEAIKKLFVLSSLCLIAGTLLFFLPPPFSTTTNEKSNIIVLVLDGLSQNITYPYNQDLQEQAAYNYLNTKGVTFYQAMTNAVYTHGFFSLFYCGHIKGNCNETNLLNHFSQQGYRIITSTFHQNGLPESNRIHNYPGLKSKYISQHMIKHISWSLRRNFHIFRYLPTPNSARVKKFEATLMSAINPESIINLQEDLPFLLEKNQSNSFFLLYHTTRFGDGYTVRMRDSLWDNENGTIRSTRKYDVNNPEDISYIEMLKKRDITNNQIFSQTELMPFLEWFEKSPYRENTYLIVTSDHGSTYSNGNLWYGYNVEEDTVRVPFFVLPPKGMEITKKDPLISSISFHDALMQFAEYGGLSFPLIKRTVGISQKLKIFTYDDIKKSFKKHDIRSVETLSMLCSEPDYISTFSHINPSSKQLQCR